MKTSITTIIVITIAVLLSTCAKEELTFNPDIDENTAITKLLETTSFFDRKETTFVITEEEYDQLILTRDSNSITFQADPIFDDILGYTHITYPYFSDHPELFFMGSIEDAKVGADQLSLSLGSASYADLFDDFLINTRLPNGYATTRSDCGADLAEFNAALQLGTNAVLSQLAAALTSIIQDETSNTFLQQNEFKIDLVGSMAGCISLVYSPDLQGVAIDDFALANFGIKISYADPNVSFSNLESQLQESTLTEYLALANTMTSLPSIDFNTDNKTIKGQGIPMTFTKTSIVGGYDLSFSGDFIFNNLLQVNTKQPLDIIIKKVEGSVYPEMTINGSTTSAINQFLTYSGDTYLGAKATVTPELLAGIAVSDLAETISIGLLLGVEASASLEGQVGSYSTYEDGNLESSNYMQGCASFHTTDKAYIYGESTTLSGLANILDVTLPNTLEIGSWPSYNIADDPKFNDQAPGIAYSKICYPDNCKNISSSTSFVKLQSIQGDQFEFQYKVSATEDAPQGYVLQILQGTDTTTIDSQGAYGELRSRNVSISSALATALAAGTLTNVKIIITDIFDVCVKSLPLLQLENNCPDAFIDESTGLRLRKYNIDLSVDVESCATTSDPVWVYQNEDLIPLLSYAPGYGSNDYMSLKNCKCYAEMLSTETEKYLVPTYSSIDNFINSNQNLDFTLLEGGNQYCTNFTPSGYIVVGGVFCNTLFTLISQEALTTDYCIETIENAYFHVDDLGFDQLNDQLFEITPEGHMSIKSIPTGILAPCRLQKI